ALTADRGLCGAFNANIVRRAQERLREYRAAGVDVDLIVVGKKGAGSELDPETQKALARGERLVATLNQPQYAPWPVEEQVMIIFAATQGYLDDIAVEKVSEFNERLRDTLRAQYPEVGEAIRSTKELSDETAAKLHEAVRAFKADFVGNAEPVLGAPAGV
ncbi:MAG: F0F1 ATP synthase subunit gamma, partial [Actinobacteria bacterium]|nr:F0F1 ATP synthase subunit gamma [Actinomycetota bacterium]